MKQVLVVLCLWLAFYQLPAQIILRNDFVINRKMNRLQNKGITMVTVNVGQSSHWNLNAYGQPIKRVDIDIQALLHKKQLTYRETVEKLYQPGAVYKPAISMVPMYLLIEPKRLRGPQPIYHAQRD